MPFTNPIVAGLDLIRRAIRSPNFITGVSGWSINRDGSAEFNDVTVRGTLVAGDITVDETGIHHVSGTTIDMSLSDIVVAAQDVSVNGSNGVNINGSNDVAVESALGDVRVLTPTGALSVANDFTVAGTATFNDTITAPLMRGEYDDDGTNFVGFTNTTPATGAPVCGFTFAAPPSGTIWVTVGGVLWTNTPGTWCALGFRIGLGSTVGAGTTIVGATLNNAVVTDSPTHGGSRMVRIGGLTPGTVYNIHTQHWVETGGNGTVDQRDIGIIPAL